jgi:hypothetical protein
MREISSKKCNGNEMSEIKERNVCREIISREMEISNLL